MKIFLLPEIFTTEADEVFTAEKEAIAQKKAASTISPRVWKNLLCRFG